MREIASDLLGSGRDLHGEYRISALVMLRLVGSYLWAGSVGLVVSTASPRVHDVDRGDYGIGGIAT